MKKYLPLIEKEVIAFSDQGCDHKKVRVEYSFTTKKPIVLTAKKTCFTCKTVDSMKKPLKRNHNE